MFDGIARRYDPLNRLMTFGLDRGWRVKAVRSLALPREARVLDLATGTADVALLIARLHPDAQVVGLDPSANMLAIGQEKVAAEGLAGRVTLELGEAEKLPYPDASFDGVTIAFGIRNVADRPAALREMARVLKPGGRLAILEANEPRGLWAPLTRIHTRWVVPLLGALLSSGREYRYLQDSMAAFPPPAEFSPQPSQRTASRCSRAESLAFGTCTLYVARPAKGRAAARVNMSSAASLLQPGLDSPRNGEARSWRPSSASSPKRPLPACVPARFSSWCCRPRRRPPSGCSSWATARPSSGTRRKVRSPPASNRAPRSRSKGPAASPICGARGGEIFARLRTVAHPATLPEPARFFGGFAFAVGAAGLASWGGFGDGRFFLPRFAYSRPAAGAAATLSLRLLAEELAGREQRETLARPRSPACSPGSPPTPARRRGRAARCPRRPGSPIPTSSAGSKRSGRRSASGAFEKIVAARQAICPLGSPVEAAAVLRRLSPGPQGLDPLRLPPGRRWPSSAPLPNGWSAKTASRSRPRRSPARSTRRPPARGPPPKPCSPRARTCASTSWWSTTSSPASRRSAAGSRPRPGRRCASCATCCTC